MRFSRLAGLTTAGLLALAVAAPAGAADDAHVRVLHGSPDAPNVDVYADGGKIVDDLAFGEITDYLAVPGATYAIRVCAAGSDGTRRRQLPDHRRPDVRCRHEVHRRRVRPPRPDQGRRLHRRQRQGRDRACPRRAPVRRHAQRRRPPGRRRAGHHRPRVPVRQQLPRAPGRRVRPRGLRHRHRHLPAGHPRARRRQRHRLLDLRGRPARPGRRPAGADLRRWRSTASPPRPPTPSASPPRPRPATASPPSSSPLRPPSASPAPSATPPRATARSSLPSPSAPGRLAGPGRFRVRRAERARPDWPGRAMIARSAAWDAHGERHRWQAAGPSIASAWSASWRPRWRPSRRRTRGRRRCSSGPRARSSTASR